MNADSLLVTSLEDVACKCFCCYYFIHLFFYHYFCQSYTHTLLSPTKKKTTAGLLNLRGGDFDHLPVFIAYAIITNNETFLYLMHQERAKNNKIDNHFQTEHVDVKVREYNDTLAGINTVVSYYNYSFIRQGKARQGIAEQIDDDLN